MFLFLSKLIPLFFYPMGAVCLLLTISLGLWWINSRWTPVTIGVALIILFLSGNTWVSHSLAQSLEWQNIVKTELPTADAIVVLGGGTRSPAYPRPDVDFTDAGDRVWYGANLYRAGKAPKIIVSGGRITWQGNGNPEADDLTNLLVTMGVPKLDIIPEANSFNTRDNAVNVQKILQEQNFKTILLVTSAMHMPRAMAIFKHLGINAIAAPTDYRISQLEIDQPNSQTESVILSFLPNEDCFSLTTQAMREYIGILVYKLRGWL
ncbi:YdcF family protein [Chamaesiphon sp. VAR_48_metabat_135_sub]|uniref:YdcF family protein n=1 Tax=Chamaesiphon sp. VAR_48_metabat_135_sub TaxID=2964699 RepID=UPI00286A8CB7|nr:YdcF family protein [Chamaesiphon sp. VAR_48_metabat_135_sub]